MMKTLRTERALTQPEASRLAGVDQVQWNKWERGRGRPGVQNALKLQAAFPELSVDLWAVEAEQSEATRARVA